MWRDLEQDPDFRKLVAARRRFTVPATLFFVVYYFALPVLVGYFPDLMEHKIAGSVNLAYAFALSQFFMAWIIAALYVRAAGHFDALARRIIERLKGGE